MAGPRVAVFGAGAFGGWTALELARRGARVTVLEAWGPGHTRASSGGETRVIRATYGSHQVLTRMAARAQTLWRAHDARCGTRFLHTTGVLWLVGADDSFARSSASALRAAGLPIEELTPAEGRRRYPQVEWSGVASALFEPEAGYLLARRACEHVVELLRTAGGICRHAAVAEPVPIEALASGRVPLLDGTVVEADAFVFACGPWLGRLFPELLGEVIEVTRQEVFYFGPPPGDGRFEEDALPVWLDLGERIVYGVPGNAYRGFKVADDTPGPRMDPTSGERILSPGGLGLAQAFIARRFPALRDAPFVGGEVCQYESTPDAHFVIDRHPSVSKAWIVGGGSGHGFKMGPAIGEMVASLVLGDAEPDPIFQLARFANPPDGGWKAKWS